MKYTLLVLCLCLAACAPSSSSSKSSAPALAALVWPPISSAEFLTYVDGKSFKSTTYNNTVSFNSGTLTYFGSGSTYHVAVVHNSNGTVSQYQMYCTYTASEFLINSFTAPFSFFFNIATTNDFSPGGITNCQKPATAAGIYYENAAIELLATNGCFSYSGDMYCVQ